MESYDLLIVGGGPGGYPAALRAAALGKTVCIFEERELGGTCLNRGCVPTKALLHGAAGLTEYGVLPDWERLAARRNATVETLRKGLEASLKRQKITVIPHRAQVADEKTVKAEGESYRGNAILLATGSRPALPPIPGLSGDNIYTSDDLVMGDLPQGDTLAIIGGGVIGVELASVYMAMGKKVILLEAMERLLPLMDREIAQNLTMILKKRGAEVYTGATVTGVQHNPGITITMDNRGAEKALSCDGILVATGRRANTENLFLCPPPEIFRGFKVDENFMTTLPGVYAVGDAAAGSIQLAHAATAQGIAFVEKLYGVYQGDGLNAVPACVYTDPEIASVGLTAEEAKTRELPVLQGKSIFGSNARALIAGSERSFVKLVFHEETHRLLGAQLMCPRAGEMLNECTAALLRGDRAEDMLKVIRPHPSFGEAVSAAVEAALHP